MRYGCDKEPAMILGDSATVFVKEWYRNMLEHLRPLRVSKGSAQVADGAPCFWRKLAHFII